MTEQLPYRLPRVVGKRYENMTVFLDSIRYEGCEFVNCHLIYNGAPGEMSGCYIAPDTVWQFAGVAAIVVETLQRYGWRFEFGTGPEPEPIRFPTDAI